MAPVTAALLFSGGLDSVCALHLLRGVQPVYVTIGHKYQERELAVARSLTLDLQVLQGPHLGHLERHDGHIPHRNAALILTAAAHGYRTVHIGALRGEASRDKGPRFMSDMERLLRTSEAGAWQVRAPFAGITKSVLLRTALEAGLDYRQVLASRSCYGAALDPCGRCQACFRRWVALVRNGLPAGERPAVPARAGAWRALHEAGLRRWPDIVVNNLEAALALWTVR